MCQAPLQALHAHLLVVSQAGVIRPSWQARRPRLREATCLVRDRAGSSRPQSLCVLSPAFHAASENFSISLAVVSDFPRWPQPARPSSHLELSCPAPAFCGADGQRELRLCLWFHPLCWPCLLFQEVPGAALPAQGASLPGPFSLITLSSYIFPLSWASVPRGLDMTPILLCAPSKGLPFRTSPLPIRTLLTLVGCSGSPLASGTNHLSFQDKVLGGSCTPDRVPGLVGRLVHGYPRAGLPHAGPILHLGCACVCPSTVLQCLVQGGGVSVFLPSLQG